MNYLLTAQLIADANVFLPEHLQLPEEDQVVPDFFIQEWIDVLSGVAGAEEVVAELKNILDSDPVPPEPDPIRVLVYMNGNNKTLRVEDLDDIRDNREYFWLELTPYINGDDGNDDGDDDDDD